MKLINFKMAPFILACSAFLALSGCDGTTGISSDSGFTGVASAPVAVDDNKSIVVTGAESPATSVDVLANDTDAENDINKTSIQIVGTANPGDTLPVPGEGSWSITNVDNVTFTPEAGFRDDPTPIGYTVSDDTNLVSNEATVTIDYTQTYFENNTLYHIVDLQTTTSEITATNAVTTISKVTVTLDITHTYVGDLIIRLVSPSMGSIVLKNAEGVGVNDGDNFTDTTFDDNGASGLITSGTAPYTGSFIPEELLSDFDGEDANGIWTLEVEDTELNDQGTLNSWSITIE